MALYYWETPSLKVQIAHQKTYKGQRKEQLGTLNIQREESDEGIRGLHGGGECGAGLGR